MRWGLVLKVDWKLGGVEIDTGGQVVKVIS